MTKRLLASSTVLLAYFLAPVSPLAVGRGSGHGVGSFKGAKMNGVEAHHQMGGRDLVNRGGSRFQDSHSFRLGGAGRAFRHAFGSVAGVFRRPAGWQRGMKTGWRGGSVPPGLAKKQSSRFAFLHHGPFARRGEGPFANHDITRLQVANFDRFLDLHPGLEKSLTQNPSLINSQAFLAAHPSLDSWLRAHPQTAEELRENPQAFMNRERRFDAMEARFPRGGEDITRAQVASFDRFLDANPTIAASLKANPSLINNSAFLAQHPALSMWLKTHPEAAEELREDPQAFFSLEQRFETTPPEPLEASNDL